MKKSKGKTVYLSHALKVLALLFIVIMILLCKSLLLSEHDRQEENNKFRRWAYLAFKSLKKLDAQYLQAKLSNLDALSITGYKLNKNGELRIPISPKLQDVTAAANSNGVAILPLISFKTARAGRIFLSSESAKNQAVDEIVKLVNYEDYSGVHLDFEYLSSEYVHKLAVFLKQLRNELRGKRLTMAVFPQVDFPQKWAAFHNLSVIGPLLDEVVIMCYDYHGPRTPPGPVVDIKWSERNIVHALQFLQPQQIWLGMPAYGYIWTKNGRTNIISARGGISDAREHKWERHPSGTVFYQYRKRGKSYQVYFADSETRKGMENLAEQYHLRGAALWRLGFEESDYWR